MRITTCLLFVMTASLSAQDTKNDPKKAKDPHAAIGAFIQSTLKREAIKEWDKDGDGHLTGDEKVAAKKAFVTRWDKNGDGKLDDSEKRTMRNDMRGEARKARNDLINKFDTNGDGELKDEERLALVMDRLKQLFSYMDRDGDGAITYKEYVASQESRIKQLTGKKKQQKPNSSLLERFDANGDGKIDESERMNATKNFINRVEDKGLQGEWKAFDKDGNGTLDDAERAVMEPSISTRLETLSKEKVTKKPTKKDKKNAEK